MSSECNETQDNSYCTFMVEGLYCGIEVGLVQEVIRFQKLTRVPLGNSIIRGLMNLRGQIVTTLDLKQRFGLKSNNDQQSQPMNVVVRTDDAPISLLVDEIGDVVAVDQDRFEPPPETIDSAHRELIRGAFKMSDRLLLILNTERVINIAT